MVVTVAQSPPSCSTMSPHWLTETTTSTTSPGQASGLPLGHARHPAPEPPSAEQAERPTTAATPSASGTSGVRARGTERASSVTDNDSHVPVCRTGALRAGPRVSGSARDQRVPAVQRRRVGGVDAEPVDQAVEAARAPRRPTSSGSATTANVASTSSSTRSRIAVHLSSRRPTDRACSSSASALPAVQLQHRPVGGGAAVEGDRRLDRERRPRPSPPRSRPRPPARAASRPPASRPRPARAAVPPRARAGSAPAGTARW